MTLIKSFSLLALAVSASADPVILPRTVSALDEAAVARAQQRDDTATRALTNTHIKTSDGKCLFVEKLSGDSQANLTPVKVAECGSTAGQGWDVITDGKHINAADSMLIVSTLTNACFDFDPRGPAGGQVTLYSCGGSPDGSGSIAASQIFPFDGRRGPLSLRPGNGRGKCLAVKGFVVDIDDCRDGDESQNFIFGGDGTAVTPGSITSLPETSGSTVAQPVKVTTTTLRPTHATSTIQNSIIATQTTSAPVTTSTTSGPATYPSDVILVSGPGHALNPTAVAEAHQRDDTAVRAFSGVSIRASNGRCLSVDRTAGDFRANLIPISLVDCEGAIGTDSRWDIVTKGRHNDGSGGTAALVVSRLTQGCISFDYRRSPGDKVLLFSCGGRADGSGSTNSGQLFPFTGERHFKLAPVSEGNVTCIMPGKERLDSGPCTEDEEDLFSVSYL